MIKDKKRLTTKLNNNDYDSEQNNLCMDERKSILDPSLGFVDVKDLFLQLHRQAISLGLSQNQLQQLHHLKRIKRASKYPTAFINIGKVILLSFVVVIFLTLSWKINFPLSNNDLASVWIRLIRGENPRSSNIRREKCLVKASNKVQDFARPPISCDFCAGVKDVLRVRDISINDFKSSFIDTNAGQPIVVLDGAANWTALDVFSFHFFKDLYGIESQALKTTEGECQFFPYKTDFKRLGQVFMMDERRANLDSNTIPWYIGWSNCDTEAGNILRDHYTKPYFLPADSESSKTDWIFMGSPGYGAHMHIDHVSLPSWQAQITGHKQWTLQPPPECYSQCPYDLSVVVHPGEIIVLDTNKWYHSTLIMGEDISITIGSEFD